MRYIISGKNLDITEGLRSAVTDKLGKLERYFTPDTEVHVTLSVEKERQKIEVTIPVKGNIIRSEQSSTDMYVSIDLVEEVIERQLRKSGKRRTTADGAEFWKLRIHTKRWKRFPAGQSAVCDPISWWRIYASSGTADL